MASTLKDIANYTGLGFATISRYLNGKNVRAENRILIQEAIEKLHFTRNEYARGLRSNCSRCIGLLLPKINDTFGMILLSDIQGILAEKGYTTIILTSNSVPQQERDAVESFCRRKVDGIISLPIYPGQNSYEVARKNGIPIVFLDADMSEDGCDCVLVKNYDIGYKSGSLLYNAGHRKAAIICGTEGAYTADRRLKGFCDAFAEHGCEVEKQYIVRGPTGNADGYNGTKYLLSLPTPPTAIFASNYDLTLGMIILLNEYKMTIGKDISAVGVDNIMLTKIIRPAMTMINQPYKEIANTAVNMLMDRIGAEKPGKSEKAVLDVSLLEGESVVNLNI
ncbi:MAG: LacI family DNA-binding transcriptional regulator [Christensenellales bacterium]